MYLCSLLPNGFASANREDKTAVRRRPPGHFLIALLAAVCMNGVAAPTLDYTVLETHPHSTKSFTQGLLVRGDTIYESSGLYSKSYLHSYHKNSNEKRLHIPLPPYYFAEGLTLVDNTLYVLTWKAGKLLRYHLTQQQFLPELAYQGQGWGLTHTKRLFIMSDGSDSLQLRRQADFALLKKVTVHSGETTYRFLNELEYARGQLWANVWQTNTILRINVYTGEVTGILDLTPLQEENQKSSRQAVLNGIAYDSEHDAYWVTGKFWPNRYLIRIQDKPKTPPPLAVSSRSVPDDSFPQTP